MKFSLFAHMERVDDQQTQSELYQEFLSLCDMADKGGMSTIWTGEHHGMDFTIAPNPFLNLVDLAHRTKNAIGHRHDSCAILESDQISGRSCYD